MKKIEKELNQLLVVMLVSTFIFFMVVLFNRDICYFLRIRESDFGFLLALVTILFLFFAYFKIQISSKKFQQEFNRVVSAKEKELMLTNEELSKTNQYLKHLLYEDSLTNLLNRQALERDISSMNHPKLIILDIDSFKEINEYYGSHVGDLVLHSVAQWLRDLAEKENLHIYRIGADEFALLEDEDLDVDKYEELAIDLIDTFKNKNIELVETGDMVEINVTLGFCFDSDNTLEKAGMALEEAKQKQINFLCYFKKIDSKNNYLEQIKWSKFINSALKDSRVIPYYQPIFNIDKEVIKHECLVRILDENEEVFPPGLFLDIAKKVKRYSAIEKLLIEKSFQMIQGSDEIISVNLLARDMSDSNVSNFVISMLKKYDVSKQIIFEILENENIKNLERVSSFIERVRRMGCKIAIDDFGTGYSNFSYLTQLKPDYIKIDGLLIKKLESDKNAYAIVDSIIAFAKKLGIKTIAEFVYNEETFEICKNLGIDEFQGFYLGEPSAKLLKR
ncbi:MAG: bifunctional diguanylate cyclase/phosphodiesterase [Sulfurospirillum sp.]